MATIYVDSAASGANDGTSWTDAYTSIASAVSRSAGDIVLVDDGHSETAAGALVLTFTGGNVTNPIYIFCVDKADDSLSTGALIESNGSGANALTLAGFLWVYGITWGWNFDLNFLTSSGDDWQTYESCTFNQNRSAGGGEDIKFLGSETNQPGSRIWLKDCSFTADSTNWGGMGWSGNRASVVHLQNCSFASVSPGTTAFWKGTTNRVPYNKAVIEDCDLSLFQNLVDASKNHSFDITFRRCSLSSSWSATTGTKQGPYQNIQIEACDDGTSKTKPIVDIWWDSYYGTVKSTLAVYRTGGADDGEQANAYSWEMASNANAVEIYQPLVSPPIAIWVDPDASISSATARGLFQSTRMDPQGTPAALTTDSGSTWNGSGVGTKQEIEVTIGDYTLTVYVASGGTLNNDDFWIEVSAPDQVGGPAIVRAFLAKPSTTVYIDPKLEVA